MVVVACNTASAHALEELQKVAPVPVEGVVGPGARAAVKASRKQRIGVIGTAGTIRSGAYDRAIRALARDSQVRSVACPLFVPLVEEGWVDHPASALIAREYLQPLLREEVDAVVLGCTHYPLLKPLLQQQLGPASSSSTAPRRPRVRWGAGCSSSTSRRRPAARERSGSW